MERKTIHTNRQIKGGNNLVSRGQTTIFATSNNCETLTKRNTSETSSEMIVQLSNDDGSLVDSL